MRLKGTASFGKATRFLSGPMQTARPAAASKASQCPRDTLFGQDGARAQRSSRSGSGLVRRTPIRAPSRRDDHVSKGEYRNECRHRNGCIGGCHIAC
ncbi:unnamed protein product, partial [Iphiclides podalirius]